MNPTLLRNFFQPEKSDLILVMIIEAGAYDARSHFTPMKKSEVNNNQINIYGNIKTILSI